MKNEINKDAVLTAAVIFAAWLIVIVACVDPGVEHQTTVIRIAYAAN